MEHIYRLRRDKIISEEGETFVVYGIDVENINTKNIEVSIPDIFFEKQEAEKFVELCNREKLMIVHLWDVIEDILS